MSTIYIDEPGAVLHHHGEEIEVIKAEATIATLPLAQIDRMVLAGPVQLTTQTMELLLKHHIPVAFMTIYGNYRGRLTPPTHANVALRLDQYRCYHDEEFRLRQAKTIIDAKLRNDHEFVQKHRRAHPEVELDRELAGINNELPAVHRAIGITQLMGVEGTAARHYFHALGKMVRREFAFEHRSKRPPGDPVNALLSLGYTLLFNEMVTAVEAIGLDPYLGFLHEVDYGRPSLALDLMEEFRYLIDALTLALINRGELVQDDFRQGDDGGWYLHDKGRKTFYHSYEHKVRTEITCNGQCKTYRRVFFDQAEALARVIRGDEREYRPFLMR
jgi:CRISPR-associated protein Cas1